MSGSNNFKVFNENLQNIMSDNDYSSNTARQNGVTSGLASSQLHNKMFRQVSIMTAALGECIKNKGLVASDSDLSALVQALTSTFEVPSYPNIRTTAISAINLPGDGYFNTLSFNPVLAGINDYDTHGMLDNGNLVCKKSGKYRISFNSCWLGGNGTGTIAVTIYKNNYEIATAILPNNSQAEALNLSTSVSLQLNDVIYFRINQGSGSVINVDKIVVCMECFELI